MLKKITRYHDKNCISHIYCVNEHNKYDGLYTNFYKNGVMFYTKIFKNGKSCNNVTVFYNSNFSLEVLCTNSYEKNGVFHGIHLYIWFK